MASTRIVLGMGLATAALALVVACSGTSTGSSSGASGTSGGTSGGSGVNKCAGTSSSKCTSAEIQPYTDCVTSKCDAPFTQCYGAGWKTGSYSGPCATYITCVSGCACGDTGCITNCPRPTTECSTCLESASSCSSPCTLPACATAGSSSGTSGSTSGTSGASGTTGKTCAQLAACCASQSGSAQMACQGAYDAIKNNGDATCNAAYSPYCPGGA